MSCVCVFFSVVTAQPCARALRYILRTELIFQRIDSALSPAPLTGQLHAVGQRILALYDESERVYNQLARTGASESKVSALF